VPGRPVNSDQLQPCEKRRDLDALEVKFFRVEALYTHLTERKEESCGMFGSDSCVAGLSHPWSRARRPPHVQGHRATT